jgi:integrase
LGRLIEAARKGVIYRGVSGEGRGVLYLLAVQTGLRAGECASLSQESFDLKAGAVTVEAGYSKRRRRDTLLLRSDLAALLAGWMKGREGLLWPGTWLERSARMLRLDLKAAGIPYTTPDGVFDFHALRHQFLTDLANSGVHPKVAQKLARHSTITLTMDRYSHVLDDQKKTALESLPAVGKEMDSQLWPKVSLRCRNLSQQGVLIHPHLSCRNPLQIQVLALTVPTCL